MMGSFGFSVPYPSVYIVGVREGSCFDGGVQQHWQVGEEAIM